MGEKKPWQVRFLGGNGFKDAVMILAGLAILGGVPYTEGAPRQLGWALIVWGMI